MHITHLASCGTRHGYERHRLAGEPACWNCLDAARRYAADYRSRRKQGDTPPPEPVEPFMAPSVGDAWRDHAACRGLPATLFFSDYGADCSDQAIAVCERCPVAAECLDWAMEAGEMHGVWGGTSPNRRRILAKYRAINSPDGWPHGRRDASPVGVA